MISWTYYVHGLLLKYLPRVFSFRVGGIVQAVALYSVSSVDQQEICAFSLGFFFHTLGEGDVVAPIGTVGRSVRFSKEKSTKSSILTLVNVPRASRACQSYVENSIAPTEVLLTAPKRDPELMVVWHYWYQPAGTG